MTISDILFARGNKNKRMNKKQTNEINQSFPLALKKKKITQHQNFKRQADAFLNGFFQEYLHKCGSQGHYPPKFVGWFL